MQTALIIFVRDGKIPSVGIRIDLVRSGSCRKCLNDHNSHSKLILRD